MKYTDKQIDDLIEDIYKGRVTQTELPEDLYFAIADNLEKGLYKGFGGDLTKFGGKDYELLNELRENVYMFSGAKTYQQVREMSGFLADSENFKQFKDKALGVYDTYNKNWLQAEYNTAIGQGMQAQQWSDIEKTKKDFPYLRYSAIVDSRTSDICEPINGVTLPVDDKFWNSYTPLNHFNCRCTLEKLDKFEDVQTTPKEDIDKLIKGTDENKGLKDTVADAFKMNSGKDGYVFSPDHPYFEVAPKDRDLARENFNLPIPEAPAPKEIDQVNLPIDERIKYIKQQAKELDKVHGETLRANSSRYKSVLNKNEELINKINNGRKYRTTTKESELELFKEYNENRANIKIYRDEMNLYLKEYQSKVADLLENKNKNTNLVVSITKGVKDRVPTINDGINIFKKVAGNKLDNVTFRAQIAKGGRAECNAINKTLSIAETNGAATVAHELAHGLEWINKDYFEDIRVFYAKRTKGYEIESLKKLTGINYNSNEITIKDNFMSPYTGKLYGTTKTQWASEITPMWFNHTFEDLHTFIEKDPEHFEAIFKLLNK